MWIETFLDYLKYERNYSARTVGEYGDDLNAFEAYFKKVDATLSWENIDGDIVRDWMVSMMEAGRAATTVNRRLSAVRALYRYALKREWVKADPARGIRGPKKKKPLPAFVKENEMDRLLDGGFLRRRFRRQKRQADCGHVLCDRHPAFRTHGLGQSGRGFAGAGHKGHRQAEQAAGRAFRRRTGNADQGIPGPEVFFRTCRRRGDVRGPKKGSG